LFWDHVTNFNDCNYSSLIIEMKLLRLNFESIYCMMEKVNWKCFFKSIFQLINSCSCLAKQFLLKRKMQFKKITILFYILIFFVFYSMWKHSNHVVFFKTHIVLRTFIYKIHHVKKLNIQDSQSSTQHTPSILKSS
jgi:hypothetical protein